MTQFLAIVWLQLRILRNDPWFVLISFAMPLAIIPVFRRTIQIGLADSGYAGASGAEHVVPGQIALFGFFLAGSVGYSIFREHGWRTWDRLRASRARPIAVLSGIGIAWLAVHILYQVAVLVSGLVMLRHPISPGDVPFLALVMTSFSFCVISLIVLMAASMRTMSQMSAFQNVGAVVFAGIGGALVPLEQLPGWAQTVAPATPTYWTMRGYRSILLESDLQTSLRASAVLLGAGTIFSALALRRFRIDEAKQFF